MAIDELSAPGLGLAARPRVELVRALLRAALPWVAATMVVATSLEPQLSPPSSDQGLPNDVAPASPLSPVPQLPRSAPKADPDLAYSLAPLPV